jgi:hypothetical protein
MQSFLPWVSLWVLMGINPLAHAEPVTHAELPVRLGAWLPYLVHPGGRATALYELALGEPTAASEAPGWRSRLIFGPELGVAVRPEVETSILVGGLVGWRLQSPEGSFTHDAAVGLAWLGASQIVSVDIDLGTGEKTPHRELKHQLLPTVHYSFGWEVSQRWGWYLDLGVGQTVSSDIPSALYYAAESGLQFRFDLSSGDTP